MSTRKKPRQRLFDIEIHADYLARHQQPDAHSDCVLWTGPRHRQGYGWIGAWRDDGTKIMTTVHRVIARQKYQQPLASDQLVLHVCGEASCVNPDHIKLGDRSEMQRMRYQRVKNRPPTI
jgi:hypothetical protein